MRLTPFDPAAGSVLHTMMTRSAFSPLLMNVLLPFDHVFVAFAQRDRANRLQVAARARLGHADGENGFPRAHLRQPALLLLFVAQPCDVRRDDVGVNREAQSAHAQALDFLIEHGGMAEIAAAVFGRQHHQAQQTFTAGLEPSFPVDTASFVPLALLREAFSLEKALRRGAQHFMVVAENGTVDVQVRFLRFDGCSSVGVCHRA